MIRIQDKHYHINIASKPVLVRAKTSGGPVIRVSEDSFRALPDVIRARDTTQVVRCSTQTVQLRVTRPQVLLRTAPKLPALVQVNQSRARVIAVARQGLPGPKGEAADSQVIETQLAGSGVVNVDSVLISDAQAIEWWLSAEDATGARRSYYVNAVLNSADIDYRKYGNIGAPVAFSSRVELQGSSMVLVVTNGSSDPLVLRTIRMQKRFN